MMKTLILASSLAACAVDGEPQLDTRTCEVPRIFQTDRVELPRSSSSARDFGFDLNDDQLIDNWLGSIVGSLTGVFANVPLDLDATATAHLTTDTDWRIAVADCADDFRLIAVTSGNDGLVPDIAGRAIEGHVVADGHTARMPLTALFDGTGTVAPAFVDAQRVIVELDDPSGSELTATIGVAMQGADSQVVHALTPFLDAHLDIGRDAYDANDDGKITEEEVATNAYTQSLLSPDLEIDGVPMLSLGVRLHATER